MSHRTSKRAAGARSTPATLTQIPVPSALQANEAEEPSTVPVTLHLTPAAHGLLVAQTAYEEYTSLEACIVHQLAASATAWCAQTIRQEELEELFLAGQVIVKKEAA